MRKISIRIYRWLLNWYPPEFVEQHGKELQQVFADYLKDAGLLKTCFRVIPDFVSTAVRSNCQSVLENSPAQLILAIVGAGLIAPFLLFVGAGISGNLLGFRGLDGLMRQNFARYQRIGFTLIFVSPVLAFLLNSLSIVTSGLRQFHILHSLPVEFIRCNFLSLSMLALSGASLVLLFGHDAIPCFVNGILRHGLHDFVPVVKACRNA